jgi:hypothetical protein
MTTDLIIEIMDMKAASNGWLWAHDSGDVILWESEEDSVDDDGQRAVARWQVTREELDALISLGEVDETA